MTIGGRLCQREKRTREEITPGIFKGQQGSLGGWNEGNKKEDRRK